MTFEPALLMSALVLGFAGSLHCVGMCGGIAGALAQSASERAIRASILHSFGRIASYAMVGVLAGLFGGVFGELFPAHPSAGLVVRVALGLLIIAVGIELARTGRAFGWIERAGQGVWRRMLPLVRRLGRPDRPLAALALGALWGWLPCGLVYSAGLLAAASGGALQGGATMVAFGLGTLPAVLATAHLTTGLARLGRITSVRRGAGALLVAFGLWSIVGAWIASQAHGGHGGHQGHGAHRAQVERGDPVGSGGPRTHDLHSAHDRVPRSAASADREGNG